MQMELSDRRRRDLVERAERNAEAFRLLAGAPVLQRDGARSLSGDGGSVRGARGQYGAARCGLKWQAPDPPRGSQAGRASPCGGVAAGEIQLFRESWETAPFAIDFVATVRYGWEKSQAQDGDECRLSPRYLLNARPRPDGAATGSNSQSAAEAQKSPPCSPATRRSACLPPCSESWQRINGSRQASWSKGSRGADIRQRPCAADMRSCKSRCGMSDTSGLAGTWQEPLSAEAAPLLSRVRTLERCPFEHPTRLGEVSIAPFALGRSLLQGICQQRLECMGLDKS